MVGTSSGRAYSRSIRSRARRRCARLASSCWFTPETLPPALDLQEPIAALFLLQQAVGEDDLDDRGDRVLARPVALQLDREGDPANRLPAGLHHAVKAGAVGLGRGAADRVDDGVDLVSFTQRVEGGEGHADFGPQGAEDELAP